MDTDIIRFQRIKEMSQDWEAPVSYTHLVTVSATGVKTTGATTSASQTGSTIGVAVDTVTTTGQQVTTNSKGEAVIGDTAVAFADSTAATAGLPSDVVSAINDINAGKPLNEVVQGRCV